MIYYHVRAVFIFLGVSIMPNHSPILMSKAKSFISPLELICLEDKFTTLPTPLPKTTLTYRLHIKEPLPQPQPSSEDFILKTCLTNPFWNDFRLLDFFTRQGLSLTMQQLLQVKQKLGIASKVALCQALIQLYIENPDTLDIQQIRFIERVNPAFCDRDLSATAPGEKLVYECICTRRMISKLKTLQYIHLFMDLFNGYTFGLFSPDRSLPAGLQWFHKKVLPFYQARHCTAPLVLYHAAEQTSQPSAASTCMRLEKLSHPSGTIQAFRKFILPGFFEGLRLYDTPLTLLDTAFSHWLHSYNAIGDFDRYRDRLQLINQTGCTRIFLD